MATWNIHGQDYRGDALADLVGVLESNDLHVLFLQETRGVLDDVAAAAREAGMGYRVVKGKEHRRGDDQLRTLVRVDIDTNHPKLFDLGGDGWTTVDGHHHVETLALAVSVAGWVRTVNTHLPPTINWPGGKITGPPDRVDDYVANMRHLRRYARRRPRDRGLVLVADWNARPGRDRGEFSPEWLADEADLHYRKSTNAGGHLWGIDYPIVDRDVDLVDQVQRERHGSDHPVVTFRIRRRRR